ncbi:MAG: hypothetical protein HY986_13585 [Candidatus Melainabacteria bacterium]|nr:hypothetical protein [Candidatus Melainabacteria bacterium]
MYRAGERLNCTVVSKEPDSYSVAVADKGLPGVLRSAEELEIGTCLEVFFVCMHGDLLVVKQIDTTALSNISERLKQESLELERSLSCSDEVLGRKLLQMLVNCGSIDRQTERELGEGFAADNDSHLVEAVLSRLKQSGSYSQKQLDELREVLTLVQTGTIKFEQLAVAHYDSVTAGVPLRESLSARGWL